MALPRIYVIRFERAPVNLCHFSLLWFTVVFPETYTTLPAHKSPHTRCDGEKHKYKLPTHAPTIIHVNFDRKTCHSKFTLNGFVVACVRKFSFWGQTIIDVIEAPYQQRLWINNYGENVCSQTSKPPVQSGFGKRAIVMNTNKEQMSKWANEQSA